MFFEFRHDFDVAIDVLELAILSPTLIERLAPRLRHIESVVQTKHQVEGGRLERVWNYQADVRVPAFAKGIVTKEMCAWEEESVYEISSHRATWTIVPNIEPKWQKLFSAKGSYRLAAEGVGSFRIVEGEVRLDVPRVFSEIALRLIVGEIRKTFEAEAEMLRAISTLH